MSISLSQEEASSRLSRFLEENEFTKDKIKTPIKVKFAAFGQSNPTLLITDAKNEKFVVRKKPEGILISKNSHAIEREYEIMNALAKYNAALPNGQQDESSVPVPEVYCLCENVNVLGTAFYVMKFVEGRIFADQRMLDLPKEERREW